MSESISDLYQAIWRPSATTPAFPDVLPPAPVASASVSSLPPPPPKPVAAGAYRPPGARAAGTLTPSVFLREDQGGAPSTGPPGAPAYQNGKNGGARGGRNVPGYVPKEDQAAGGQKKGKKDKKGGNRDSQPQTPTAEVAPPLEPTPVVEGDIDPIAKKIRNLSKKVRLCLSLPRASRLEAITLIRPFLVQLKAIDDLKDKLAKGEKLECVLFLTLAPSLPCCSLLTLSTCVTFQGHAGPKDQVRGCDQG